MDSRLVGLEIASCYYGSDRSAIGFPEFIRYYTQKCAHTIVRSKWAVHG